MCEAQREPNMKDRFLVIFWLSPPLLRPFLGGLLAVLLQAVLGCFFEQIINEPIFVHCQVKLDHNDSLITD
jgi:hypothetical protein